MPPSLVLPAQTITGVDRIHHGSALSVLRKLPPACVHTVVTSPPYYGLRDYGVNGQIGLEQTPAEYVTVLVNVFREVRRVLRDNGTLWLNLGDSYGDGKQLLGIPWRTAFALQDDGWILRSDIIWSKPNPMPESVTDRPTKAHEYIFLLSKSPRYYYDADAILEPLAKGTLARPSRMRGQKAPKKPRYEVHHIDNRPLNPDGRNRRTVWNVATHPFKGAHFATFPPKLIEPCILAGCPAGGVVLDPFFGSGTTGEVAIKHRRHYIGIELNAEYIDIANGRLSAPIALSLLTYAA